MSLDRFQYGETTRQLLLFALYQRFTGMEIPDMAEAKKALAFAEYVLDHQEQLKLTE